MTAGTLLLTWTGPARRRALLNDALVYVPILLALTALAWRGGGAVVGASVLGVGVALALFVGYRRAARFDRHWLVQKLDGTRADMEDSAELLFAVPQTLGDLQRLQQARLFSRLEAGRPDALRSDWSRRPILAAWVVASLVIGGAVAWPRAGDRPVVLAPSVEQTPVVAGVPRLVAQNLRIFSPGYTGLPMRDERQLDARAPRGSRL